MDNGDQPERRPSSFRVDEIPRENIRNQMYGLSVLKRGEKGDSALEESAEVVGSDSVSSGGKLMGNSTLHFDSVTQGRLLHLKSRHLSVGKGPQFQLGSPTEEKQPLLAV